MNINTPISIGELWDKYSILLIKIEKIKNDEKLKIVSNEIQLLQQLMNYYPFENDHLFINLKYVNQTLWDIEDKLRIKEKDKEFDDEFLQFARQVYYTNDKRHEIKLQINKKFGSIIHEVKDYTNYKL